MDQTWYVYIIRCADNALYTGITTNPVRRLREHNSRKGSRSVVAHGTPASLVHLERYISRSEALKRECEIKSLTKDQKEKLIRERNKNG